MAVPPPGVVMQATCSRRSWRLWEDEALATCGYGIETFRSERFRRDPAHGRRAVGNAVCKRISVRTSMIHADRRPSPAHLDGRPGAIPGSGPWSPKRQNETFQYIPSRRSAWTSEPLPGAADGTALGGGTALYKPHFLGLDFLRGHHPRRRSTMSHLHRHPVARPSACAPAPLHGAPARGGCGGGGIILQRPGAGP